MDLDFKFDMTDFDLPVEIDGFAFNEATPETAVKTDFVLIKRYPRPKTVKYEYAADLCKDLPDLQPGEALYAVVSGNFIFGDFIEALMVEKNYFAQEIIIATLSLGQENVDSLKNIKDGGYVDQMGLIVSDYWYAHERRRLGGVPYIVDTLGGPDFRFAAAGLHTKVTLIKTQCGKSLVLHGSANLRSSRNVEQLCIENNEDLYGFNREWMETLLLNFSATNKSLRGDKAWQKVQEQAKSQS